MSGQFRSQVARMCRCHFYPHHGYHSHCQNLTKSYRRTISNKGECVTRHKDRVVVRRYMSIFINVMIFLVPRNAKCHNGSGEYIPENVLNVLECNIQPFDVGYFCHFVTYIEL